MTDKSSRREFLRTVTLAGAAAAAGGVAGCAAEPEKVALRQDGMIIIKDPELIRMFHEAYDEQARAVRNGESNRRGIRFKVPKLPQSGDQADATTSGTSDNTGKFPINNLCGCRGISAPDDSGTTLG